MLSATTVDLAEAVERLRNRWPTVALAVGGVQPGRPVDIVVRGLADIGSGAAAHEDTAFRIASITKTLTAIAVMTLVEQGLVDLDQPVSTYLRGFRLVPADGTSHPPTVRQLLTHTSGLPEVVSLPHALLPDFGESVAHGTPVPSLSEYYGGTLRVVDVPGQVFRYTNHGPATLGQLVEDVSGLSLGAYLRARVLDPWGMSNTDLARSRGPDVDRATGYRSTARGPREVPLRDMATVGAAAAWSTTTDMTRYATGLLGGGTNEFGSVLRPESVATMFAPHYRPHPSLPGMGLGFFRGEVGGHALVEHQGILPGFDSNLILAPDDGAGLVAMATGARLGMFWLPDATRALLAQVLGIPPERVREDVPQHPEVWPRICGWYKLPASISDVRLRSIIGAGVQVLVRRGRLTVRCLNPIPTLWRGVQLHPDDPDDPLVFRFDLASVGLGTSRIAFRMDVRSDDMAMDLEIMPLTAYRRRLEPVARVSRAAATPHQPVVGRR